jgi:hypothetical protein
MLPRAEVITDEIRRLIALFSRTATRAHLQGSSGVPPRRCACRSAPARRPDSAQDDEPDHARRGVARGREKYKVPYPKAEERAPPARGEQAWPIDERKQLPVSTACARGQADGAGQPAAQPATRAHLQGSSGARHVIPRAGAPPARRRGSESQEDDMPKEISAARAPARLKSGRRTRSRPARRCPRWGQAGHRLKSVTLSAAAPRALGGRRWIDTN